MSKFFKTKIMDTEILGEILNYIPTSKINSYVDRNKQLKLKMGLNNKKKAKFDRNIAIENILEVIDKDSALVNEVILDWKYVASSSIKKINTSKNHDDIKEFFEETDKKGKLGICTNLWFKVGESFNKLGDQLYEKYLAFTEENFGDNVIERNETNITNTIKPIIEKIEETINATELEVLRGQNTIETNKTMDEHIYQMNSFMVEYSRLKEENRSLKEEIKSRDENIDENELKCVANAVSIEICRTLNSILKDEMKGINTRINKLENEVKKVNDDLKNEVNKVNKNVEKTTSFLEKSLKKIVESENLKLAKDINESFTSVQNSTKGYLGELQQKAAKQILNSIEDIKKIELEAASTIMSTEAVVPVIETTIKRNVQDSVYKKNTTVKTKVQDDELEKSIDELLSELE